MPEVSVVIPTYNSASYVPAAVESVLAQTFRDIEIVVVDDGSTDDTEAALEPYRGRIRYIRQANSGVAVARNMGVRNSSGHWISFLDADDAWHPEKIQRQLSALADAPDCRAVYTAITICDAELRPIRDHLETRRGASLEDLLLYGNVVGTPSTVLCDRGLFIQSGGFDSALSQCADWEMWVRLSVLTEFACVSDPLVLYRVHGNNMSRNISLLESDSVRVLEAGFGLPNLPDRLRAKRRSAYGRNYMVLAGSYFQNRQPFGFARCAARALALDPGQVWYLASYPLRWTRRLVGRSPLAQA